MMLLGCAFLIGNGRSIYADCFLIVTGIVCGIGEIFGSIYAVKKHKASNVEISKWKMITRIINALVVCFVYVEIVYYYLLMSQL